MGRPSGGKGAGRRRSRSRGNDNTLYAGKESVEGKMLALERSGKLPRGGFDSEAKQLLRRVDEHVAFAALDEWDRSSRASGARNPSAVLVDIVKKLDRNPKGKGRGGRRKGESHGERSESDPWRKIDDIARSIGLDANAIASLTELDLLDAGELVAEVFKQKAQLRNPSAWIINAVKRAKREKKNEWYPDEDHGNSSSTSQGAGRYGQADQHQESLQLDTEELISGADELDEKAKNLLRELPSADVETILDELRSAGGTIRNPSAFVVSRFSEKGKGNRHADHHGADEEWRPAGTSWGSSNHSRDSPEMERRMEEALEKLGGALNENIVQALWRLPLEQALDLLDELDSKSDHIRSPSAWMATALKRVEPGILKPSQPSRSPPRNALRVEGLEELDGLVEESNINDEARSAIYQLQADHATRVLRDVLRRKGTRMDLSAAVLSEIRKVSVGGPCPPSEPPSQENWEGPTEDKVDDLLVQLDGWLDEKSKDALRQIDPVEALRILEDTQKKKDLRNPSAFVLSLVAKVAQPGSQASGSSSKTRGQSSPAWERDQENQLHKEQKIMDGVMQLAEGQDLNQDAQNKLRSLPASDALKILQDLVNAKSAIQNRSAWVVAAVHRFFKSGKGGGHDPPSKRQKNVVKRTPCKFFAEGRCDRGDQCTFLHGDEDAGQEVAVDPQGWAQPAKGGKSGKGAVDSNHIPLGHRSWTRDAADDDERSLPSNAAEDTAGEHGGSADDIAGEDENIAEEHESGLPEEEFEDPNAPQATSLAALAAIPVSPPRSSSPPRPSPSDRQARDWMSVSFDDWLLEVGGGKDYLVRAYLEEIEKNFDDLEQVFELYTERSDVPGKGLIVEASFFSEMKIEKAAHKKLFERWFADQH